MDLNRLAAQLVVEHQHPDGSWGQFQEREHTAVDHDPERGWHLGRLFKCSSCDQEVRVVLPDEGPPVR